MKSVRLRELAQRDVEEAVDYYAGEGGEALAMFIDALELGLNLTLSPLGMSWRSAFSSG